MKAASPEPKPVQPVGMVIVEQADITLAKFFAAAGLSVRVSCPYEMVGGLSDVSIPWCYDTPHLLRILDPKPVIWLTGFVADAKWALAQIRDANRPDVVVVVDSTGWRHIDVTRLTHNWESAYGVPIIVVRRGADLVIVTKSRGRAYFSRVAPLIEALPDPTSDH